MGPFLWKTCNKHSTQECTIKLTELREPTTWEELFLGFHKLSFPVFWNHIGLSNLWCVSHGSRRTTLQSHHSALECGYAASNSCAGYMLPEGRSPRVLLGASERPLIHFVGNEDGGQTLHLSEPLQGPIGLQVAHGRGYSGPPIATTRG